MEFYYGEDDLIFTLPPQSSVNKTTKKYEQTRLFPPLLDTIRRIKRELKNRCIQKSPVRFHSSGDTRVKETINLASTHPLSPAPLQWRGLGQIRVTSALSHVLFERVTYGAKSKNRGGLAFPRTIIAVVISRSRWESTLFALPPRV